VYSSTEAFVGIENVLPEPLDIVTTLPLSVKTAV
jgi:hypothetical protein